MTPAQSKCGKLALVFGGLLKLPLAFGFVEGLRLGRSVSQGCGFTLFSGLLALLVAEMHKESAQAEADGAADDEKDKSGSFHAVGLPRVSAGQEQRLQVVQKVKAAFGGFDAHEVAFYQTLVFGFFESLLDSGDGQAGFFTEILQLEAVAQA